MQRTACFSPAFAVVLCLWPALLQAQEPVKFRVTITGHQVVQVKVNGRGPYEMVFNTGAALSVIAPSVGRGTVTLEIGGAKADVNVVASEPDTLRAWQRLPDLSNVQGVVGFDFFSRFRVTIDYQKQEMTFVPNGYNHRTRTFGIAPSRVVLGLAVEENPNNDRGVRVTSVLPGSAGEAAGVMKNDLIITLGSFWIDEVRDFAEAVSWLEPGQTTRVHIIRDGKPMALQITPCAGL